MDMIEFTTKYLVPILTVSVLCNYILAIKNLSWCIEAVRKKRVKTAYFWAVCSFIFTNAAAIMLMKLLEKI